MKNPFTDIIGPALEKLAPDPAKHPIGEALITRLAEKHQLVTREEFAAQAKLLASYETKIQMLELEIARLEQATNPAQSPATEAKPDNQPKTN